MNAKTKLAGAASEQPEEGDDAAQLSLKTDMWMHMLDLVRSEAIVEGKMLFAYLVDMAMVELRLSMETRGGRRAR